MPATNRTTIVAVVFGLAVAFGTGVLTTRWMTRGDSSRSALDSGVPDAPSPAGSVPTAAEVPAPAAPNPAYTAAEQAPLRDAGISTAAAGEYASQESSRRTPADAQASENRPPLQGQSTGIYINQKELTPQQVADLVQIYRYPPPRGHFWYDPISGLYGVWEHEAAGYIAPGHNFGPLSPDASAGNTGVFINGRQLNAVEVNFLQILFNGQVRQGRVWLDGRTWNIGPEGNPNPIANLAVAIRQAQQRAQGGGQWGWRDGSGATMASDGKCTMMAVPGAPVYGTSGC